MLYNECSIGFLRKCRILKLKDDEDEEGRIPLANAKLQNIEKEIRRIQKDYNIEVFKTTDSCRAYGDITIKNTEKRNKDPIVHEARNLGTPNHCQQ